MEKKKTIGIDLSSKPIIIRFELEIDMQKPKERSETYEANFFTICDLFETE